MSKQLKIYLSHSIRGKFGINATPAQMNRNCRKATVFGKWLRKEFPFVKLHIPAEFDEWIQVAYMHRVITEKQILDVDCEILSTCSGMVVYMPDNYISKGMQREIDHCKKEKIPYIQIATLVTIGEDLFYFFNTLKGLPNE